MNRGFRNYWIIPVTIAFALVLTIMPLPGWAEVMRPDWVLLVLLYWCMALPEKVGITTAFIAGLLLDVALASVLGQHSLALIIIAFLISKIYQRVRVLPELQQSIIIFVMLVFYKLLLIWFYGITHQAPSNILTFFISCLTSALLWPWVFIILRNLRRKFTNRY